MNHLNIAMAQLIGIVAGIIIAWFLNRKPVRPRIKRIKTEKFDRVTRGRRIW